VTEKKSQVELATALALNVDVKRPENGLQRPGSSPHFVGLEIENNSFDSSFRSRRCSVR
jgi:hypothetical protein